MLLALTLNICLSAVLILFSSHKLGRNGTCAIIVTFNFICVCIILIQTLYTTTVFSEIQYSFYNEKSFFINFEWGFSLDIISLFFMFIILFITTAVLCFACSYMYTDIRFTFFISFLQFFMFFMLILVLSKNIIQLFIGWEGVGIISFLSINFWYLRLNANKASLKALIFNRIGDFGYIGFVVICVGLFKTTTLTLLPLLINQPLVYEKTTFIVLFIVLAIFGKSAQLVLYAWLPDAMEGPTPVSALLHSATMVTAGVYLFLRLADIVYNSSAIWIYSILIICGITSIFCGLYALVKFDIKKIIAFSTCSQLGLMFCTIALGFTFPAFYHLFIHAFFKALLFISSGIIIHALADEQDIRKYGINSLYIPFYHLALLIGSINIMGIFFVSGFYSKETLLLTSVFSFSHVLKSFILISSLFTIMYSIRLFFYSNGIVRNIRVLFTNNHSLDGFFIYAVCSLSLMSIFIGFYFVDIFNGLGTNQCFIISVPYNTINFELVPNSIIFLFPIFILGFFIFMKNSKHGIYYIIFL
jgi:NADH:ubiquinone oxidoreductase subunit 5 (subunit L)/multisubunit Na+/H+ antiporter MnhA subunit